MSLAAAPPSFRGSSHASPPAVHLAGVGWELAATDDPAVRQQWTADLYRSSLEAVSDDVVIQYTLAGTDLKFVRRPSRSRSIPRPELLRRFTELAAQWRDDTATYSSLTRMISHPAYLQIIAMGSEAVPLLLRELVEKPDHWFAALGAITQADPADPADPARRGDFRHLVEAWLYWGRQQGYIA